MWVGWGAVAPVCVDAGLVGYPLDAASSGFGNEVDQGADGGAEEFSVAEHDVQPAVDVDLEAFQDGFHNIGRTVNSWSGSTSLLACIGLFKHSPRRNPAG